MSHDHTPPDVDALGAIRFAAAISTAESIGDLVDRLYANIHLVFRSVVVGFDTFDPRTHSLRSTSARGVSSFFLSRYDQVARADDPVLQRAIESRRPAYNLRVMSAAEWRAHPLYRDVFALHRMTDIVYAPVVVDDDVIATLNLGRTGDGGPFTDAELERADEVARYLGSTVDALQRRARLERELRLARAALDLATDAVVVSDLRGAERRRNHAAEAILSRLPAGSTFDQELVAFAEHDRSGPQYEGPIQRTVTLDDEAVVTFLRSPARATAMPDWLLRSLTPREVDTVSLVARGLRDQEIADRLNLSVHTVKGYLREALRKTGARSRVEIARMAVEAQP